MSVGILDSLFDLIGDTMVFVIGGTVALGFLVEYLLEFI